MTKLPEFRFVHKCLIAVASGGSLALTAFAPHWALQLPALVAIAPVFWLLRTTKGGRSYVIGVCFAAAWLVPTTYWYYNFMSLGVAFGASVGWAFLIANLFWLTKLRRRVGTIGVWLLFIMAWLVLTWLRMRAPITEDWWLPHLGYSVWQNSGLIWLGKIGGELVLEVVVLLGGSTVAGLLLRKGWRWALAGGSAVIMLTLVLNFVVWQLPAKPIRPVIALQKMTRGGVDVPATWQDVDDLMGMTRQALGDSYAQPTTIVWPENSIPEATEGRLKDFAQQYHINLVYHTSESDGEVVYKKVVVIDGTTGRVVLANYKQHLAPDEEVGVSRGSQNVVELDAQRVTAYVCYDMHYPDSVERMRGGDVVYVPLNDATYGYLQKQFHAADIALHAAQANVTSVAAATNGPTMIVNSNGVVVQQVEGGGEGSVAWY